MGKNKRPGVGPFQPLGAHPRVAHEPTTGKVPRVAATTSYLHLRPSWRVGAMEMVDPFGWHTVDRETLVAIRQRLAHFETMTWAEILVKSKKQNHSIQVDDLCAAAQRRLEARKLLLDDVVSLRLTGRERVYGYLDNGVLVLLWWDPVHEICPSLKE